MKANYHNVVMYLLFLRNEFFNKNFLKIFYCKFGHCEKNCKNTLRKFFAYKLTKNRERMKICSLFAWHSFLMQKYQKNPFKCWFRFFCIEYKMSDAHLKFDSYKFIMRTKPCRKSLFSVKICELKEFARTKKHVFLPTHLLKFQFGDIKKILV